ncbi:hypothetical protein K3495_g13102 [Podosphaera aphanis]|nr:hypothetical protein K3495_g13102 [Podosphaera aphanis]
MSTSKRAPRLSRDIDAETRKPKLAKPSQSIHESPNSGDEGSKVAEDSSVATELNVTYIDSTTADPRADPQDVPRQARHTVTRRQKDPQPQESGSSVSPTMLLMLGSTLNINGNMIVYPGTSDFIPDFHNFFDCLHEMHLLIYDNKYFQ